MDRGQLIDLLEFSCFVCRFLLGEEVLHAEREGDRVIATLAR